MMKSLIRCALNCLRAACGVAIVFATAVLAIKICALISFGDEGSMLSGIVPLLCKIVWPTFFLIVIFYFKRYWERVLYEIPGLVRRSYLPYSPQPPSSISANPNGELISTDNSKSLFASADDKDRAQSEHDNEVHKILELLEQEYGVSIVPEARVLDTGCRADGAFIFGRRYYYVAVLPAGLVERVPIVLSRMNEAVRGLGRRRMSYDPVSLICVYGGADFNANQVHKYRSIANHDVIVRVVMNAETK